MKNVPSRINISIKYQAAVALVCPDGKRFLDDLSAPGTGLGSMLWINLHQLDTGAFSLVFKHLCEGTHSNIKTALGEVRIAVYECKCEVFHRNAVIVAYKFPGKLMQKISTLIRNMLVKLGKSFDGFASGVGPFLFPGNGSLEDTKPFLGVDVKFWRVEKLSVRGRYQMQYPKINTDYFSGWLSCLVEISLNRQANVPSPVFPENADKFDTSVIGEVTVPLNSNWRHFCQDELFVGYFSPIVWPESNAVESGRGFESWKSRFVACFYSAEERLESNVESPHRLLKRGAVYLWVFCFSYLVKRFVLVKTGKRKPIHFPGIYPLLKSLVVKASVAVKDFVKHPSGRLVRIDSVLICTHLLAFLSRDVGFHCFFGNMPNGTAVVRPAPKRRESCRQLLELFPQYAAGPAFESKSNPCRCPCRVTLNKQVNVIRHYLKGVDRKLVVLGNTVKDLLQPCCNFVGQHFTPVFWTPDKVIFQAENRSGIFSVFAHALYAKLCYSYCQPLIQPGGGNSSAS